MVIFTRSLWRRKQIDQIALEGEQHGLQRVIGPTRLIALGVGTTIGAGLFSLTGVAAAQNAGPAVILSFIIAAVACAFAAFCYAELASMIPTTGSAYSYAYATLGELIAWIIGWDLVLEYTVGAALVSVSWSSYLVSALNQWGIHPDPRWLVSPWILVTLSDGTVAHGWANLPAMFAATAMTILVARGISASMHFNMIVVVLKFSVVILFMVLCTPYITSANFHPFLPANDGTFGHFGWSGVMRASGMIFFAYLGFDIIAATAQETIRPERTMPIGILGSLIVCTVIYVTFALVLIGVVNFHLMGEDASPVATAIDVTKLYWLQGLIKIAILIGYASGLIGLLVGQVRIFFAMSHDGLLPPVFGRLNAQTRTPVISHFICLIFVAFFAGFFPISILGNMVSIGTLLAFALVCSGVFLLRIRDPDRPRAFKAPGGLATPLIGVIICLVVMSSLDLATWIRLIVWLIIGLIIYTFYGARRSRLAASEDLT